MDRGVGTLQSMKSVELDMTVRLAFTFFSLSSANPIFEVF